MPKETRLEDLDQERIQEAIERIEETLYQVSPTEGRNVADWEEIFDNLRTEMDLTPSELDEVRKHYDISIGEEFGVAEEISPEDLAKIRQYHKELKSGGKRKTSKGAESNMPTETDISMFAIHNDTDKWAVIVDGRIGLYDSEAEAEKIYDMVGGDPNVVGDELSETPFGASQILRPGFKCENCYHEEHDNLSDYENMAGDLASYIEAEWKKVREFKPAEPTREEIEEGKKFFDVGPDLPSDEAKTSLSYVHNKIKTLASKWGHKIAALTLNQLLKSQGEKEEFVITETNPSERKIAAKLVREISVEKISPKLLREASFFSYDWDVGSSWKVVESEGKKTIVKSETNPKRSNIRARYREGQEMVLIAGIYPTEVVIREILGDDRYRVQSRLDNKMIEAEGEDLMDRETLRVMEGIL